MHVAPTILLVDDSESARGLMRRMLEQAKLEVTVLEANNGAEALPMALSGRVDIVVSDIVMPQLDGIGLLRGIRQQRDADSLPVILVTSEADQEKRETSFEVGVNDYLSRPFSSLELISRIQVQLRLKNLQQELRRATEYHRRLGTHDELTGLANRRHLLDLCRRELARSRRHKFAMSVAVMDIDNFREINNRVGHLVGDAIIAELADVLQRDLRAADILARTGGQKFGLLLPQTDEHQGRLVCDRACAAVASHAFPGNEPRDLTLSVGMATYPAGRLESVDELINAAEASLERAKGLGGDRVEVWSDMDD